VLAPSVAGATACCMRDSIKSFAAASVSPELQLPVEPIDVRTSSEFEALIGKSALPVLVDFWAPWCGPCKMAAPEVSKVATSGAGRWLVAKANTDELPEMATRFGIRAIPTLAVFHGGRELVRHSGVMPAPSIEQLLRQAL
jgi:thioredoxin 2